MARRTFGPPSASAEDLARARPAAGGGTGLVVARWTCEPGHTAAEFRARHMMVTWVRGLFTDIHGSLEFDWDESWPCPSWWWCSTPPSSTSPSPRCSGTCILPRRPTSNGWSTPTSWLSEDSCSSEAGWPPRRRPASPTTRARQPPARRRGPALPAADSTREPGHGRGPHRRALPTGIATSGSFGTRTSRTGSSRRWTHSAPRSRTRVSAAYNAPSASPWQPGGQLRTGHHARNTRWPSITRPARRCCGDSASRAVG